MFALLGALLASHAIAGNPVCYSCYMTNNDPNKAITDGLRIGQEMRIRQAQIEEQKTRNAQYQDQMIREQEYQSEVKRIFSLPVEQRKNELTFLMVKFPEYKEAIATAIEIMNSPN